MRRVIGILGGFSGILIGAFFGAAAVYLAVGLEALPILIGAALGAVVYAGLWRWQAASRRNRPGLGKALRAGLILFPVGAVLLFGAGSLITMYRAGQIGVPLDDRLANFDRLWQAVSDNYPYFTMKGVDWQAVRERYRPQVESLTSDDAYYLLVAEMLAELHDGHTSLDWPYPQPVWQFGTLTPVGDLSQDAAIRTLGEIATAAGLKPGDRVTAIDGRSLDEAIAALHPTLRTGSTPWNERARALRILLSVWGNTRSMQVTVQGADGVSRTVTLNMPSTLPEGQSEPPHVTGSRLPSGVGVIVIPTFSGSRSRLVGEFDAVLDSMMDTPGVILDVRGNGGGNSLIASEMAGRFLSESFTYAREYYRQRLPERLWGGVWTRSAFPRGAQYTGPVVLLTDGLIASSGEEFILMLADNDRAQTVGRPTAGSTGNPLGFPLPGEGSARFSSGSLHRVDDSQLEGLGVAPDVPVLWTVEDLRAGRDPDVEAAERLILGR